VRIITNDGSRNTLWRVRFFRMVRKTYMILHYSKHTRVGIGSISLDEMLDPLFKETIFCLKLITVYRKYELLFVLGF